MHAYDDRPASVRPAREGARRRVTLDERVRRVLLVVHRYVGLVLACFLIVAGVTGSVIAFYVDLDAALNPELLRAEAPYAGAQPLDPFELRERLIEQLPSAANEQAVILHTEPGRALNYWVDSREVFVDPYTGRVLGSRTFGDVSEGRKTLLTFIYRLHFSLALGDVGVWIFGVIALLWCVDCFVGAYLTFPPSVRGGSSSKSWLSRWLPAWLIKANKLFSFVFTWHRASGLWVWGALLVFAWSAVALNLSDAVYRPVMQSLLGPDEDPAEHLPELEPPRAVPPLPLRPALGVGRRLMAEQASGRGFEVLRELGLHYSPEHGAYAYTVESTLDISPRLAQTTVHFDADGGRLLAFSAATGQNANATFTNWIVALHFGSVRAGGIAYRAFVCALGLLVTALSVTGVWIWWRKRSARVGNVGRRRARQTAGVSGADQSTSVEDALAASSPARNAAR